MDLSTKELKQLEVLKAIKVTLKMSYSVLLLYQNQ